MHSGNNYAAYSVKIKRRIPKKTAIFIDVFTGINGKPTTQCHSRMYSWTVGRLDSWTVGRSVSWLVGRLVSWTVRQLDSWSVERLSSSDESVTSRRTDLRE
jgi:hypothetical protein